MPARGTPPQGAHHAGKRAQAVCSGCRVPLPELFFRVQQMGGFVAITSAKEWPRLRDQLGIDSKAVAAPSQLRKLYEQWLLPVEAWCGSPRHCAASTLLNAHCLTAAGVKRTPPRGDTITWLLTRALPVVLHGMWNWCSVARRPAALLQVRAARGQTSMPRRFAGVGARTESRRYRWRGVSGGSDAKRDKPTAELTRGLECGHGWRYLCTARQAVF